MCGHSNKCNQVVVYQDTHALLHKDNTVSILWICEVPVYRFSNPVQSSEGIINVNGDKKTRAVRYAWRSPFLHPSLWPKRPHFVVQKLLKVLITMTR